jgi:Ca-activated chloride channel family protein
VLRVGVATKTKSISERKPEHLVFLVDVSGSMNSPDRLELAKTSLRILTNNLGDNDTVAIVTYAGDSRIRLAPTGIAHKDQILAAIDELHTGGGTAMGSGVDLAYSEAMKGLQPGAVSRVIVCTDGDANVGPHSHEDLLHIIESRAKQGVTLSTIGFGMGNYKDTLMEQLADKGYGNNYYIDGIGQAERVFGDQLTATLEVAAKDVKLQVDFDPTIVSHYRLIGYENRDVADKDFRNDQVGGGQVGWGHQVTAMYELELAADARPAALGTVHIRHKAPEGDTSVEETFPMTAAPAASLAAASPDLRFAFAVAALADVLRDNPDAKPWSLDSIRSLASDAAGGDKDRLGLLGMLDHVKKLRGDGTKIAR